MPRVSFGDHVRAEARRLGLDDSAREVLQAVGEALIGAGWERFCRSVLAQADWTPGRPLVIDGVRHVQAVETLRPLVAPAALRLVYLEVPESVRERRLRNRGTRHWVQPCSAWRPTRRKSRCGRGCTPSRTATFRAM